MLDWWRRWRDRRTLARRPIPEDLWALTLARYPFLAQRSEADQAMLRELSTLFLADKEFAGMEGLEVDDGMAVGIAAQGCLPVLRLGLDCYDGFKGIVVYPDTIVARREEMDDTGIVHEYDDELLGEAMPGGPMRLSWPDVEQGGASATWVCNVVIHEFAHVLDMRDGLLDGVPLLPDRMARRRWVQVLEAEWDGFRRQVDAARGTLLDPYGAESIDEFFAVASEVFFVDPVPLRDAHRALYELLAGYYRQDPAAG